MPTEYLHPGVYVEEIPSSTRTIAGVPTSTACFIGCGATGPEGLAVQLFSFGEFEREFGGHEPNCDLSYSVAQYFQNGGSNAWVVRVVGAADPVRPMPDELVDSGLGALDAVDSVNLLISPNQTDATWQAALIDYADRRRAFAILDFPAETRTSDEAEAWLTAHPELHRSNAAIFHPRILAPDAAQGGQVRSFTNSGAIAGVFARIDQTHGVWKAPAGADAVISGITGLADDLTEPQREALSRRGVNVLREVATAGHVVWGARTLLSRDQSNSDWKYIPVRRLALFLEESLYRGLKWVVFEPNDESLWSKVRLNTGAFMHALFSQGAFRGSKASEAYFVKCDASTTTQSDLDAGNLIIWVGFAPLKPAEFVVIQIRLIAGQESV